MTNTRATCTSRCLMINLQLPISTGVLTSTQATNVHWRLLRPSSSNLTSNGICTMTAASKMLDQLLRMAFGRGKLFGMRAPERGDVDKCNAQPGYDQLGEFNGDSD